MSKISSRSIAELLRLHTEVLEELRKRGVVRSANNPTGDLAEYLFCRAFSWEQAPNSERGFDATGSDKTRYQIMGRRMHQRNKSRQLSAIRDLEGKHFDILAAVLFDDHYYVLRAALIPRNVIKEQSTYVAHTNSHKYMLRDVVWDTPGVANVIKALRAIIL